ncbi:MAG TPA: hypothetical protein VJB70_05225 [Candidatus Paceibacterota bacterium]
MTFPHHPTIAFALGCFTGVSPTLAECAKKEDAFASAAKTHGEILLGSGLVSEVVHDQRVGGQLPEGLEQGNILSVVTQPWGDSQWTLVAQQLPNGETCVVAAGKKSWDGVEKSIVLEIGEESPTFQIMPDHETGRWYMILHLFHELYGFTIARGNGWATLSDADRKKRAEKYLGGKI